MFYLHCLRKEGVNADIIAYNPKTLSIPQHFLTEATPIATTPSQHLPHSFFARPAEVVAPELIGCLLVKRMAPQFPDPGTNTKGMLQAL